MVRGVNDDAIDRDQTSLITIRVNDASSDNGFDDVADQTVAVTTADNDLSDFGDAPDSYGTTLANGARHLVSATGPKLGSLWDGETNGLPSVNALADGVDEDYAVKILDGDTARRLTVNFPSGGPAISVANVSSNLEVKAGATLITRVPVGRVSSLEINGSSGRDTITLSALPTTMSGHVTLNGGVGNDSLNGASAGIKLRLNGDAGNDLRDILDRI